MDKCFYVYIMASKKYGTLYTGVTSDLIKRIYEHKEGNIDGFTKKHNIKTLVHYEQHDRSESAFLRETQIKRWKRQWKINLIEESNPHWKDLYELLF